MFSFHIAQNFHAKAAGIKAACVAKPDLSDFPDRDADASRSVDANPAAGMQSGPCASWVPSPSRPTRGLRVRCGDRGDGGCVAAGPAAGENAVGDGQAADV